MAGRHARGAGARIEGSLGARRRVPGHWRATATAASTPPLSEPSLPDKVVAIDRALDDATLSHAFGGALALAYYAEPRTTVDIDVNVFVGVDRWDDVAAVLAQLGIDTSVDPPAIDHDGQARVWWGRTPVDVFLSYDPFHEAMKQAARRQPFGDNTLPVLAPEHLLVCKAVSDRAKDWLDIAQMLAWVDGLDLGEVRRWLGHLLEADDPRRVRFESLASEVLGR